MIRKLVQIDEEACNGCGACAEACHEGAIAMVDGKAKLVREDYCDGLGDCLPACPAGAISFVEREAPPYDAAAAARAKGGCPGSRMRTFGRPAAAEAPAAGEQPSALRQWPVQLQLVPADAPYFDGCDLLVAADCTAFACGSFHRTLLQGRICLVACPKLDRAPYAEKLAEIFRRHDVRSVTVARMEVPCCGGLTFAVQQALEASGKDIPLQVVTLSTDGRFLTGE